MPDPDSTYQRLRPYVLYLKPVRWHFGAAIFFGLIYSISSGFGLPWLADMVFPKLFGEEPPEEWLLLLVVAYLPFIFFIRGVSQFLNGYLINYCGIHVLEKIRMQVFEKLQRLPLAFYQKHDRGDLISRSMSDTVQLQSTVVNVSNDLVVQPMTFVSAIFALVYLSLKNDESIFILLSLMAVPICVLPIYYVGKRVYKKAKLMQKELGVLTDFVSENIGAAREVKAFCLEEEQIGRFEALIRSLFRLQLKVVKYTKMLSPMIEIVASIGVAIAIYYAAKQRIELEEIVPLLFALQISYDPIKKIGNFNVRIRKGLASLDRLEEILHEPETVGNEPGAEKAGRLKGEIVFDAVSFSYDRKPVLKDVSYALEAGRAYALVGPSGAGKSTFANLVLRFYDAERGRVLIDEKPIRSYELNALRRNIALVPQDPVLFDDTFYNNILLSRPDATREEVEEAARSAYAHDFIVASEKGYDTVVGERGGNISGGQRQRIALARAFLKNAPIVVLDEATSALDSESEALIQQALQKLVKGKTVIIIAHRFSTIRFADEILLLREGSLEDKGSHEELYERNETYRALYDRQR